MSSGYYPAGAENDPNAPYNEREPESVERDCEVTETLTRTVPVSTQMYTIYPPEPWNGINCEEYDFDCTDWEDEYKSQYLPVPALIKKMRELLDKWKPQEMSHADKRLYSTIVENTAEEWDVYDLDVTML